MNKCGKECSSWRGWQCGKDAAIGGGDDKDMQCAHTQLSSRSKQAIVYFGHTFPNRLTTSNSGQASSRPKESSESYTQSQQGEQ